MKLRHRLKQRNKRRWNNGATKHARIAAKDTTVIPQGYYCYGIVRFCTPEEFPKLFETSSCPYWKKLPGKYNARCTYLEEDDDLLLWDKCKICDVKYGQDNYNVCFSEEEIVEL